MVKIEVLEVIKYKKCPLCQRNLAQCDKCAKKFKEKQEVFCFNEQFKALNPLGYGLHYCSEKCMYSYLKENIDLLKFRETQLGELNALNNSINLYESRIKTAKKDIKTLNKHIAKVGKIIEKLKEE